MKQKFFVTVALGTAIAATCLPGFAHHGSAAYETNNTLTLKATITDFRFINPHCQVFFYVKNDKGEGQCYLPTKSIRSNTRREVRRRIPDRLS